jgi:hypothetical protein
MTKGRKQRNLEQDIAQEDDDSMKGCLNVSISRDGRTGRVHVFTTYWPARRGLRHIGTDSESNESFDPHSSRGHVRPPTTRAFSLFLYFFDFI